MATETIDHTTLHRLVEAGAVRAAHVVGTSGGWALTVKFGLNERPLAAQRSRQIRLFKKLETLVSYLKDVGIAQFDVDASNYSPESQTRNTRPDRSAALKRAHEAVGVLRPHRRCDGRIDEVHLAHARAKRVFDRPLFRAQRIGGRAVQACQSRQYLGSLGTHQHAV